MRTTITMDEGLFEDARRAATRGGATLSAFIGEALRERLARRAEPAGRPFQLVVFGEPGAAMALSPQAIHDAFDDEDVAHFSAGSRAAP